MTTKFHPTIAFLTITALLSSTTFAASMTGCNTVYDVRTNKNLAQCQSCYKRVLTDDGGCGGAIEIQHCLDQVKNPTLGNRAPTCALCEEGYALRVFRSDKRTVVGTSCVPGIIQDCAVEVQPKISGYWVSFCYACKKGLYSFVNKFGETHCIKIDDPIENCEWGSVYEPKGKKRCGRCEEDYSLNRRATACIEAPVEGCYHYDEMFKYCKFCDALRGYSMNADGKCSKMR